MTPYWITVSVPAHDYSAAYAIGLAIAADYEDSKVVSVDPEPPQGSLIVGDYNY